MGVQLRCCSTTARGVWLRLVAVIVCVSFLSADVFACVVFYIDYSTGKNGVAIADDCQLAEISAEGDCVFSGGNNCEYWWKEKDPGWGAIYYSGQDFGWFIGSSAGYRTKKKAKHRAKQECQYTGGTNCQLQRVFNDPRDVGIPDKSQGTGFHLSSEW